MSERKDEPPKRKRKSAPAQQGMRQHRGRERRAAVLQASRKLFSRHGFRGTSLAAIADEVGITDAGLLYHFPTKKDLLLAVIIESDQEQEDRLAGGKETSGLAYLKTWEEFGKVLEDDLVLVALDVLLSAEHLQTKSNFNQYYRRRYVRLRERLIAAFEQGRTDGHLRNDFDAEAEAALMIATIDGMRIQWLLSDGKISLAENMRYFIRRLIKRVSR